MLGESPWTIGRTAHENSRQAPDPGPERRSTEEPTDLAHAPSRALSAGVSWDPGGGGLVPGPLLQPGPGNRGDAAADPALRLRRGDPVLRHPGGGGRPGPEGELPRRARAGARAAPERP